MNLYNLSIGDIEVIAYSEEIFKRGISYYNQDFVENLNYSNDSLSAEVKGKCFDYYKVTAELKGNRLCTTCSCPCAFDGCKHIVATLRKWLDICYEPGKPSPELTLKEMLSLYTKDELIGFIQNILDKKPELERDVCMNLGYNLPSKKMLINPGWKHIIKEIYDVYEDYKNYSDASVASEKLKDLKYIITGASFYEQFELYHFIINRGFRAIKNSGKYDDRLFSELKTTLIDYMQVSLELSLSSLEKYNQIDIILDYLLEFGCFLGKEVIFLFLDFCNKKEIDYLIRKLRKELKKDLFDYSRDYIISFLGEIYLKNGNERDFLDIQIENLRTADDYSRLVDYWKSKGEVEKAIKMAEKGCNSRGDKKKIYKFLEEIYKKRHDNYRLWKILNKHFNETPSISLYKKIMDLKKKSGKKFKFELSIKNIELLIDYLIEDRAFEEAIELVRKEKNISLKRKALIKMKEDKPCRVIEIYKEIVDYYISKGSCKYYKVALKCTKEIKDIYLNILKSKEGWREFVKVVKKRNVRKKKLLNLFADL